MHPLLRRLALVLGLLLVLVVIVAAFARSRFRKSADTAVDLLTAIECGKGDQDACKDAHASRVARCTRGDGQGCVLLGIEAEAGKFGAKNDAEALRYFELACNSKDPNGCWYFGTALARGKSQPKDEAKAVLAFQKGCDIGGDVNVCDSLGEAYEHGRGVNVDKARALTIYDRGCSFGKPGAMGFVCEHAKRLRAAQGTGAAPAPSLAKPN